jgi:hypothetical protein
MMPDVGASWVETGSVNECAAAVEGRADSATETEQRRVPLRAGGWASWTWRVSVPSAVLLEASASSTRVGRHETVEEGSVGRM